MNNEAKIKQLNWKYKLIQNTNFKLFKYYSKLYFSEYTLIS